MIKIYEPRTTNLKQRELGWKAKDILQTERQAMSRTEPQVRYGTSS
ncbi:hypothetical protein HY250_04555 [Candidatus Azambacteria bacterium]|nr:hypothetical protein [Candidatus Azambacteria bacterium]